jgi:ABC-type uncharacterized transport system involved in gliding motility auxiliary subunit
MAINNLKNGPGQWTSVDLAFVEHSYLTYIVPLATDLNLEEAFKNVEDTRSLFGSIDQRSSIFFGRSEAKGKNYMSPLLPANQPSP